MDKNSMDSICSVYNDEDFANHITINLFKKKNNIRVSRINSSKRESRSQHSSSGSLYKTRQTTNRTKFNESSQFNSQINVSNSTSSQNISHLDIGDVSVTNVNEDLNTSINSRASDFKHVSDKKGEQTFFPPVNHPVRRALENTSEHSIPPTSKASNISTDKILSIETLTPAPNPGSDDLTPLSWLQSLDMGGVVPHLAAPPTPPASPISNQNSSSEGSYHEPPPPPPPEKIDYSVDGSVKPPYSYATLIGMAMKENDNKMTLSAIYKWIKEHFIFYKTADQSWQNSIRHNLSLNKCFIKVARSKDEPGKGGFWKLDPEYADSLVDGVFKKRRPSKSTAPPATKSKRKKIFPYSHQTQVESQKQKDMEELMRQKEQDEAVRSLLQPVQASYMPPPTDKPPSISAMYIHQDMSDQVNPTSNLLVDEGGNPLKEDFVWSSILGDEGGQDECWQLSSQEVVTDLTQSGDPSTYQVTMSPASSVTSLSSSTSSILNNFVQQNIHEIVHPLITLNNKQNSQNVHTLPSFDLSPESLGVDEDLFGSPNYSETSNDGRESLLPSFDLGVGLDLAVSTSWESKIAISSNEDYDDILCEEYARTLEINENDNILMNMEGSPQELIELHDLEGNLSTLTTLEPVAPVVVQQVNPQSCWTQSHRWEETKSLSYLEANLDFDKLIDLDVI